MQRLTATIERVVNRLNYIFKIIKNGTIKIMTNKSDYHKIIIDMLKDKTGKFHAYKPRQQRACRVVIRNIRHSVEQELLREGIERMGHKIRKYESSDTGSLTTPLSLFFLDIEPAANNSEIYYTEYLKKYEVQTEPPHQKQNNIPQCKRCQA
jgi:hypothetical protein